MTTVTGVINTIYTGYGGAITYYVPKNTTEAIISSSGVYGSISTKLTTKLFVGDCPGVVSIKTNEIEDRIYVVSCSNLAILEAAKAIQVDADGCALTAKSIGDILYAAYNDDRAGVHYDFSGGTSAGATAINAYLVATYAGLTLTTVKNKLVTALGGVIITNPL